MAARVAARSVRASAHAREQRRARERRAPQRMAAGKAAFVVELDKAACERDAARKAQCNASPTRLEVGSASPAAGLRGAGHTIHAVRGAHPLATADELSRDVNSAATTLGASRNASAAHKHACERTRARKRTHAPP